jgi:hypothetical protein
VLGLLGALGAWPFVRGHAAITAFVVLGCAGLAAYGGAHLWRRRGIENSRSGVVYRYE